MITVTVTTSQTNSIVRKGQTATIEKTKRVAAMIDAGILIDLTPQPEFVCPECGKIYRTTAGRDSHVADKHEEDGDVSQNPS